MYNELNLFFLYFYHSSLPSISACTLDTQLLISWTTARDDLASWHLFRIFDQVHIKIKTQLVKVNCCQYFICSYY